MAEKNETKHLTAEMIERISGAHTAGSSEIIARIRAVAAGLQAGVTVKTMTADIREAAERGMPGITPVNQTTLGYAAGTIRVLDGAGVTLERAIKADRDAVADTYRAIYRHGIKNVAKSLTDAAIDGGTEPAEKVAALGRAAKTAVDQAIKARKNGATPRTGAGKPPAGTDSRDAVFSRYALEIAADLASGKYAPTEAEVATMANAISALAAELKRASKAAPKATPAKVAAPAAA